MVDLKALSRHVVECLINDDYDTLEKEGGLAQMSKELIRELLEEYGGENVNLTQLPDEAFLPNLCAFGKVDDNSKYYIAIDLWIDNECSDLSLLLDVYIDENDNMTHYVIDDIHVM